jgi:hypothetical protein
MAHGAFDTVGGMRAGLPLVIDHLVAVRTGFPGWKQPMVNMLGLIQLSHGRLDGSSQNEKNEEDGTEQTRAETIHGQISCIGDHYMGQVMAAVCDAKHISP